MKATNRRGYHYEHIHKIMQWLDEGEFNIKDISYFQLKDSIVVQLFNKGKYAGCVVTLDILSGVRIAGWSMNRHIRIRNKESITAIPLSKFKQRNNGKLYDKAIN
jgi:hypothetical protein